MALEFTDENFEQQVIKSDKLAVVDFWATWCGPCRILAPVIDELYNEFNGRALVGKLDVDANNQTAAKYSVRSIPTILFIKAGEVVDKHVGNASKGELEKKINALL